MKKLFLLIIFALGVVLAEPVVGNAYVISALGIKNTPNNIDYVSGDTSVGGNANYVLAPQVIIYQEGLSYVGSYTPFTGCLNSQHYTNGAPDGLCITGIINDLTTGGTDKALSAEQGKILNDKITNLQNITRINYLRPTLQTTTLNGITCTNNGDGTYTLNGTATDWVFINLTPYIKYKGGAYRLVGCPKGGNDDWNLYMYDQTDNIDFGFDHGDGSTFKLIEGHAYVPVIRIKTGVTFNNTVFKPMLTTDLNATYDDFVPYQDSLAINQSIIDATRTNLLSRIIPTQSKNGITITNNGDGTYTINGTAITMTSFIFQENLNVVPNATYKLVGSPRGKSIILAALAPDSDYALDFGDGGLLTTDQSCIKVYVQVNEGVVCDNVVVKPMLTTDLDATYDDFVSFDNSIVTGINSGLKMDLLWTNASPTSAFVAHTISLDLSKYKAVYILSRYSSDMNVFLSDFLIKYNFNRIEHSSIDTGRVYYREINISNDGIYFGNCFLISNYGSNVTSVINGLYIPYQIYGVR